VTAGGCLLAAKGVLRCGCGSNNGGKDDRWVNSKRCISMLNLRCISSLNLKSYKAIISSLLSIALSLSIGLATGTSARDYGQYSNVDPAIREWIESLKDKTGLGCCATADGHPAEYEWDIAGNQYKVRIEGAWYVVPDEAVVDGPNKLGYATVWYWWSWDIDGEKTYHIRCFLPGPGG
jgi:hypothetical protein